MQRLTTKKVSAALDPDPDHGLSQTCRKLAIEVSSGKDAGRVQVIRGWVVPERYARPFKREEDYRNKAELARQDQRGLWSLCQLGMSVHLAPVSPRGVSRACRPWVAAFG